MDPLIACETRDDIGLLRINRPQARNALNGAAREEFAKAIDAFSRDKMLRALIITGTGEKAFASGGDIRELANEPNPSDGEQLSAIMGGALKQLTTLPVPVIAAVNGDAIGGGCEILTACDLRISAPHARYRFPHVHLSLTTGWGGTARLVRLVGQSKAAEMLLMGRFFSAEEVYALGFIHMVVEKNVQALEEALKWAREISSLSKSALAAVKRLIVASGDVSLEEEYASEQREFLELWSHPDRQAAMNAFRQKR